MLNGHGPMPDAAVAGAGAGTLSTKPWLAFSLSLLVYVAATAVLGRDVLGHLSTHVANDPGDPLLTAAILQWNATHIPLTDAWWQLPAFYPTRDTLAFSENLLGLSVIASPLYWITGDALVTYNLTALLTFPLCAAAMYAFVYRLTRNAAGAFIAGLVFGFAPYRISQLPHIQMLAIMWAPLALLGLHAFLDTGRKRWLALYGGGWMLQGLANGYCIVFFSVFVGLWVLWFVVAERRWRAFGMIALATVIAALPLVPVLYQYVVVHGRHGFVRGIDEIRIFSADVSALLCAPPGLTFWGWVRVSCRAEGELFPGAVTFALFAAAIVRAGRGAAPFAAAARPLAIARHLLLAVGIAYSLAVAAVLWFGPLRFQWGPLRISATSVRKPLLVALVALGVFLLASPNVRAAVRRSWTLGFYLVAAVVTWLLSLGPTISFLGVPTPASGPYGWLMVLPGANGLRCPARFWIMTMICLATAGGIVVSDMTATRRRAFTWVLTVFLAAGVLSDGWVPAIVAAQGPPAVADVRPLRDATVMELPVDDYFDIGAQYRGVIGGWRTVNGYSGYGPSYYLALKEAVRQEVDDAFLPFQTYGELHVIVPHGAPRLTALIERQPGVVVTARDGRVTQYRLPQRPLPAAVLGTRVPVAGLRSECGSPELQLATDGSPATRWVCFSEKAGQELTVDLGRPVTISAIVDVLGPFYGDFPQALDVDTSVDGTTWEPAWRGNVIAQAIAGSIASPLSMRIALPFSARQARLIRLNYPERREPFYWSIAELEVWSP